MSHGTFEPCDQCRRHFAEEQKERRRVNQKLVEVREEQATLRAERDTAIAERDAERERCAAIAEEMACGPFVEEARVMAGAVAGAIREGGRSGVQLAAIIRNAERAKALEKALVRYGRHDDDCQIVAGATGPCTCGFTDPEGKSELP